MLWQALARFSSSRQMRWQTATFLLGLLALVTLLGLQAEPWCGLSAVTLAYLLPVLVAAYAAPFAIALSMAFCAALCLNYFFIEPRWTLQIAHLASWWVWFVFMLVAVLVSTTVSQLKTSAAQAAQAAAQAQFFQGLAELCAQHTDPQALLSEACQRIAQAVNAPVSVCALSPDALNVNASTLTCLAGAALPPQLSVSSVQWALDYQRAIGADTPDWPQLEVNLFPFGLQSRCLLLIGRGQQALSLPFVQLMTQQLAQAHARVCQTIALAEAQHAAQVATFKKTMLTAISHDMRTPLTVMMGAAQVLADGNIPLESQQAQQLLQSIQQESAYLVQTTENILTLVRLEAAMPLALDWQSPEDIVRHVAQRYQARAEAKPMVVEMSQTERLLKLDGLLVAQALANVLDNADRWHTGPQPIRMVIEYANDILCLRVKNHGPALPAGFSIQAFQQGATPVRLSSTVAQRGFGLGLVIVKAIMEAHGGRLELTCEAPDLTQVSLCFPCPSQTEIV